MNEFKFGDEVHVRWTKGKDAFDGVVTFVGDTEKHGKYYHVRDTHGAYWHRTKDDLSLIEHVLA